MHTKPAVEMQVVKWGLYEARKSLCFLGSIKGNERIQGVYLKRELMHSFPSPLPNECEPRGAPKLWSAAEQDEDFSTVSLKWKPAVVTR